MPDPKIVDSGVRNVTCGHDVRIIMPSNVYDCVLGDSVLIGPFVEVQRSVLIGARTKIQSHSFICEWVTIGEDCFIGHGVMFINDRFAVNGPARGDRSLWRATRIGDRVSIGSNATILPVDICNNVVIGAGAVVTRAIHKPGIYAGNPARLMRSLRI